MWTVLRVSSQLNQMSEIIHAYSRYNRFLVAMNTSDLKLLYVRDCRNKSNKKA